MRFFRLLIAAIPLSASLLAGAQQISAGRDIRWPVVCNSESQVYVPQTNSCKDINVIDSGTQLKWPANCSGPSMVYMPGTNQCIGNGSANNPGGTDTQLQGNCGGSFCGLGVTFDSSTRSQLSAAALNGVYDIKGAFGASGSQQTISCTATAGSSTLTGCSSADFKIGQGILIPSAGASTVLSTPAAPTVACVPANGASCTGSIAYCYKIAAIQSAPNGAMTAASPQGCSTQSAQTMGAATGDSTTPVVRTTVVLPGGTKIRLYAVYRSVNGGPYNFYTLIPPQTMSDYNDRASIFTCGDLAVPCTAPASTVPNDVYAKITAINGSTLTIAPWPAQPRYNGGNNGDDQLAGFPYYPSQPQISGTVNVQHDDTLAFFLAGEALRASTGSGQLQLHIPAGNYNLHSADPYGIGAMMHLNMIRNLTLAGDGDASRLLVSNDRGYRYSSAFHAVCGYGAYNPSGNCTGSGFSSLGTLGNNYTLVDPVVTGASTVTLATPSDAANFVVGGYVNIFTLPPAAYNSGTTYSTGQTATSAGKIYISLQNANVGNDPASSPTYWQLGQPANGNGYPASDYAELNKVLAIDAASGILTLAYPATKYYSANLIAPYNICTSCQSTPVISPLQPGGRAEIERLTMRDFYFRGQTIFANWNAFDYITESNLTIITNEKDAEGVGRHHYVTNERLTEDGGLWGQGTYFATAAAASADILVTGSHYVNSHIGNAAQPCSEGSVNVVWKDNVFDISGISYAASSNTSPLFGQGTVAYGCEESGNTFNIHNTRYTNLTGVLDTTGSTYIHGNTINIDKAGNVPGYSVWIPISATGQTNSSGYFILDDTNVWNVDGGYGARISASSKTAPEALTSYNMGTVSGSVATYPQWGSAPILSLTLGGNISSFNLGGTHMPGMVQWLRFIQASSGGPYTLPALCSSWSATMDCGGSTVGPKINPAAGSSTYVQIWDDGTAWHIINSNYRTTNQLADWSNTGAAVNYVATCKAVSGGSCTSWGPQAGAAGGPVIVQNVDTTGLVNNVGNTTLFAVPSGTVHKYRLSCYLVVTTAATTSATVPTCVASWTDADSGAGAKGFGGSATIAMGFAPGNSVGGVNLAQNGTNGNGILIRPQASTNITYQTTGYASSPANMMTYALHLTVEDMGP